MWSASSNTWSISISSFDWWATNRSQCNRSRRTRVQTLAPFVYVISFVGFRETIAPNAYLSSQTIAVYMQSTVSRAHAKVLNEERAVSRLCYCIRVTLLTPEQFLEMSAQFEAQHQDS
jgi:hypothetical protein